MTVSQGTTGHEVVTPSGIRVYYQSDPRLYRVNDEEVPSFSKIADVLYKGGLSWHGMTVGVAGVLELFKKGELFFDPWAFDGLAVQGSAPHLATSATLENVVDLLKRHKLTVNDTLKRAGDRGTAVHRALEVWADDGTIPDPSFYPDEEAGYVKGLRKFLLDLSEGEPDQIIQEVMVGSVEHGYAGRFDLRLRIQDAVELVIRQTTTGRIKKDTFAGTWLLDLKTSRSTYDTHHLQLAAYELAAQECGYGQTDGQAIIRVDKAGHYEVTKNRAEARHFLALKACYDAVKEL